ncbi:signal peptide peptidase SppA [Aidingimonas lacisalsi]|uniref:signal peptide peptidase SppA n=1 Tax=Aidingimonas lacisalsi TaxID=2604086 RepID=UPI0011D1AD2F|nr:signal peptide peptidase SppA [Aidingimonas lacisalsi]
MSNESHDDKWTQGPEVPPDASPQAGQSAEQSLPGDDESVETLRERQRLAQLGLMDRWVDGVLKEQRRSRRWKLFFRFLFAALLLTLIAMLGYGLFMTSQPETPEGPHLGLVEVDGVIDAESAANARRVIEGLERAWDNDAAEAVVLHINSPGGSPVQSQRIFNEVMRLRDKGGKPIIAVIEDIGASGGYYIAAAADEIVASPSSLVGSIGVVYSSFGLNDAIEQLGIERRVFTAGDNKAFLDPFSELDSDQRVFWQDVLDTTHQQFIDAVKRGRGERLSDDEDLFSGLIWTGEQGVQLGLVDELGSLDTLARDRLEEPKWRDYTPALDPFDRIARRFGRVAAEWLGLPTTESPVRYQAR